MQSIHYLILAQAIPALFLAFYLTRRMRGFIRASVVRLMPVRHRISDESFNLQTRISTIVAFLLGLLLTGLFYWGINEAVQSVWPGAIQQEETTQIAPEPVTPLRVLPPPATTVEEKEPPTAPPPKTAAPIVREYETVVDDRPETISGAGRYYLQLYAFLDVDRALLQESIYSKRLPRPVSVRKVSGTIGPYKVLVGPFSSRREAMQLVREHHLDAMVIPEERLQ